jgi:CubicO group peptidase (beta-lactamase class C family)
MQPARPNVIEIHNQGAVRELGLAAQHHDIRSLTINTEGFGSQSVAEILDRHVATGMLIVHRGNLVHEWYADCRDPNHRNRCYSITKSFTGILARMAASDGLLDRTAKVEDLVPDLSHSGFAGARVADVANMTASIGYSEVYTEAIPVDGVTSEPTADKVALSMFGFADYMTALGLETPDMAMPESAPRSIRAFLAEMPRGTEAHGTVVAYATPVTDVLGWLLETSRNTTYAELFKSIWTHIGAESSAYITTDPNGTPVMGGGLAITTRDLTRFGMFLLEAIQNDQQPLAGILDDIRNGGDPEAFARNTNYGYLSGYTYKDQWWLPGGENRPMLGWGIHGQMLWVDPTNDVVIAYHSDGPIPSEERRDREQDAMCRAITAVLTAS